MDSTRRNSIFFLLLCAIAICGSDITSTQSSQQQGDVSVCATIPHKATWLTEAEMLQRIPPTLLSFPGSGNTWARLLIEGLTGILTGSIDSNDLILRSSFEGERACGLRQSAVKGHPSDYKFVEGKGVDLIFKWHKRKCQRGWMTQWKRFILLVRNPYNSMFSEYQRQATGSHTGVLTEATFNETHWAEYIDDFTRYFEDKWLTLIKPMMASISQKNLITLKYENLLVKGEKRVDDMINLAAFMQYNVTRERARCTFEWAEKDFAHRKSNITASFAFNKKPEMICDAWRRVKGFSDAFGYGVFENKACPQST